MASADEAQEVSEDAPMVPIPLPKVKCEETAEEEKFDCPQPWLLALLTMAMSAMTSITVAGSLFFLLAAPEKVSPHCYEKMPVARFFCTGSTIAFWTYPVVCCLFVVIVYAKNLVDQRTYYEFLLHKVIIGYGKNPPYKQPVVLALLVYALCAFSTLVWYHYSQTSVAITHVYSSLAYITPIISFLAVIFTQWSIQGKLVTLPNFLEDYDWARKHLNASRCYSVETLHAGYLCLEHQMEYSDEQVDTQRMVALVEHFSQTVEKTPRNSSVEESKDGEVVATKKGLVADIEELVAEVEELASEAEQALVIKMEEALSKEWVYWEVRLLFNPRLQDDRSQSFRNWALAYMLSVILAILMSVYIFVCCLITCLEIEKVLTPNMVSWQYTHYFSLRPDLGGGSETKSFKQVAASVAMSAMQTGARSFYNRAERGLQHFQIGAAA